MMRQFPAPWTVEENKDCFVVRDVAGLALAHVHFAAGPRSSAAPATLTQDEARLLAKTIATLPVLLRHG